MTLPGGYMGVLSAGPSEPPYCLGGPIGASFLTPDQQAARNTRAKYGSLDDPDAGGYHLAQVDWDKDTGNAEVSPMEAGPTGWYAAAPGVTCSCTPGSTCGCQ